MSRRLLIKCLPKRETIEKFKLAQRCAPFLMHPDLWAVRRNLVAGGVAVGLFCGMIPGPLQIICAIGIATLCRFNLSAAVLGTFASNPLTIVPLYMLALQIGQWLFGTQQQAIWHTTPIFDWHAPLNTMQAWFAWLTDLSGSFFVGLSLLASALALLGYGIIFYGWRLAVIFELKQRKQERRLS